MIETVALTPAQRTAIHTARCMSIRRYLRSIGAFVNKNLGALGVRAGLPDFFVCLRGRFIAIEVKTGGGVLSKAQREVRDELILAGALYIVAENADEVEDALAAEGLVVKSRLF